MIVENSLLFLGTLLASGVMTFVVRGIMRRAGIMDVPTGDRKTHERPVAYEGGFSAIEGIDVMAGDKIIGRTGSQSQGTGLAMLRLDRLADALGTGLGVTAGGIGLSASKPPYASFDLPGVDA